MEETARKIIAAALAEDIGAGDVTSAYFVAAEARGLGRIVARQPAVVAGVAVAAEAFAQVDPTLRARVLASDGEKVDLGAIVLEVEGQTRSILTGERVALNFLQRLSGVATLTRQFAEAVSHTSAVILDTRKTTPGLRVFEKAAVVAGGGQNHRFGLFDRAMVKDNHLVSGSDAATIGVAIARLKKDHPGIEVELEADTLAQVRLFLGLEGVDYILLDNMSLPEMATAVELGRRRVRFEASGGVNLQTVAAVAETGVDFISVGALTHSAPAVDFSLDLAHG